MIFYANVDTYPSIYGRLLVTTAKAMRISLLATAMIAALLDLPLSRKRTNVSRQAALHFIDATATIYN